VESAGLNTWQLIQQGWIATYPLILMSIVSLTVICERLWSLRGIVGRTVDLTRALHGEISRGAIDAAMERAEAARTTAPGRIFGDMLRQSAWVGFDQLEAVGAERRYEELERLKSPLWTLGTVASSAPFIGLFGTVVGIMRAFHDMATMGSGGFAVVAAGISEALIATALGLGVAIVALIFYNYFQVRLDRIEAAFTIGAARLVEALRADRGGEPAIDRVAERRR
jgi:biopolymer transport protein ExbB